MMDLYAALKIAHIIGAAVLLGTGAGIAFFMVMANRTGDAAFIAKTARIVVIADYLFTASAVVVQPATGFALAWMGHYPLLHGWLMVSLVLHLVTGAFWLPVIWIQSRLRDLARTAAEGNGILPAEYHSLYRLWLVCGAPAFTAVLGIIALMVMKPAF